jgi:hypothetical protein
LSASDPFPPSKWIPLGSAITPALLSTVSVSSSDEPSARDSQGDTDFITAQDLFRALETPFYLAVTMLEHAEALVALGQDAEPFLAQSLETFSRSRCRKHNANGLA